MSLRPFLHTHSINLLLTPAYRLREKRGGKGEYHFSLSINPWTNQRCIRITTSTGGNRAIIAAAITRFHSGGCVPVGMVEAMPTTTTFIFSELVTMRGQRYWFQ